MSTDLLTTAQNILLSGPIEKGQDTGIFSKIKETLSDVVSSTENKVKAFNVFEKNLMFLKGFGLLLIVIMAIYHSVKYKDVGLISKKPLLFFAESLVFGASTIVPFFMLAYLRNQKYNTNQILIIGIVLFLVFIGLNYLLELSGLYAATFETHEKEKEQQVDESKLTYTDKLKHTLGITSEFTIGSFIGISLIVMLFASLFVRDVHPGYIKLQNLPTGLLFLLEAGLFGAISAVPIFFMASNRNALSKHTTVEFGLITFKFVLLHCLLQFSGFYSHTFKTNSEF